MYDCWLNMNLCSVPNWMLLFLFVFAVVVLVLDLISFVEGLRSGKMPALGAARWARTYFAVEWRASRPRYFLRIARNTLWIAVLLGIAAFVPWALCHLTPKS